MTLITINDNYNDHDTSDNDNSNACEQATISKAKPKQTRNYFGRSIVEFVSFPLSVVPAGILRPPFYHVEYPQ